MQGEAEGEEDEEVEKSYYLNLDGTWTVHAREDPGHFDQPASIEYSLELKQKDHRTFIFAGGGDVHDPETRAAPRRFEIEGGTILGCQVFLNMRWPSGNVSVCELETCRQVPHSDYQCPEGAPCIQRRKDQRKGSSGVEWVPEAGPDVDMLVGTYSTISTNNKIASRGFIEMLKQSPDEVVLL